MAKTKLKKTAKDQPLKDGVLVAGNGIFVHTDGSKTALFEHDFARLMEIKMKEVMMQASTSGTKDDAYVMPQKNSRKQPAAAIVEVHFSNAVDAHFSGKNEPKIVQQKALIIDTPSNPDLPTRDPSLNQVQPTSNLVLQERENSIPMVDKEIGLDKVVSDPFIGFLAPNFATIEGAAPKTTQNGAPIATGIATTDAPTKIQ